MIEKRLNPFTNALVVPYIEMVQRVERDEDGNLKPMGYRVEQERHTRVYTAPVKRDILFRKLSPAAFKLFWFIVYTTAQDHEYVVLTYEKVDESWREEDGKPVSPRGYKDALRELVSMNLVDPKSLKDSQYWVNPAYFCPGNRIEMYRQCALKVATHQAKAKELS